MTVLEYSLLIEMVEVSTGSLLHCYNISQTAAFFTL